MSTPKISSALISAKACNEAISDTLIAEAIATDAQLDSSRRDANLFSMLRSILAFNSGVFIIKDRDRIAIGAPVETICYAAIGEGCDEREAVEAAYYNCMNIAPTDRKVVGK